MKTKILHLIIIAATLYFPLQAQAETVTTENISSVNTQIAASIITNDATISTTNNFTTQIENDKKINFIKTVRIQYPYKTARATLIELTRDNIKRRYKPNDIYLNNIHLENSYIQFPNEAQARAILKETKNEYYLNWLDSPSTINVPALSITDRILTIKPSDNIQVFAKGFLTYVGLPILIPGEWIQSLMYDHSTPNVIVSPNIDEKYNFADFLPKKPTFDENNNYKSTKKLAIFVQIDKNLITPEPKLKSLNFQDAKTKQLFNNFYSELTYHIRYNSPFELIQPNPELFNNSNNLFIDNNGALYFTTPNNTTMDKNNKEKIPLICEKLNVDGLLFIEPAFTYISKNKDQGNNFLNTLFPTRIYSLSSNTRVTLINKNNEIIFQKIISNANEKNWINDQNYNILNDEIYNLTEEALAPVPGEILYALNKEAPIYLSTSKEIALEKINKLKSLELINPIQGTKISALAGILAGIANDNFYTGLSIQNIDFNKGWYEGWKLDLLNNRNNSFINLNKSWICNTNNFDTIYWGFSVGPYLSTNGQGGGLNVQAEIGQIKLDGITVLLNGTGYLSGNTPLGMISCNISWDKLDTTTSNEAAEYLKLKEKINDNKLNDGINIAISAVCYTCGAFFYMLLALGGGVHY